MKSREQAFLDTYNELLKQGVQEAEARDRASMAVVVPEGVKDAVNPELPSGKVVESVKADKAPEIKAARKEKHRVDKLESAKRSEKK